jgi:antitoxin VapB
MEARLTVERRFKLLKIDGHQIVNIPPGFELLGEDVIIRKTGDRLIIEPAPKRDLIAFLDTLEPLDEEIPEIEDLPPRPVEL